MQRYILMTAGIFVLCSLFVMADSITDKMDTLKKKRSDAAMQLYNRRIKMIDDDPKLKEIHEKIMSLHKELALRLENDREVIELSTQLRVIDEEIEKLSEQMKKDEPVKEKEKKD